MQKNILKINRWKETQKRLFDFIQTDQFVTGEQIRNWIADCIVFFSELKMENYIVEFFLSKLDFVEKQTTMKRNSWEFNPAGLPLNEIYIDHITIGPFTWSERGYSITDDNRLTGTRGGRPQLTPIIVAFKIAEHIVENYEDEERVIPKTILNQFENLGNKAIYLSLKGIQDSYNSKDTKGMLSSLITATDLICGLIPELKGKNEIKKKLDKIYSDATILSRYTINNEYIWALNNSRLVRNCEEHNPKIENHTTLFECVSYCHILVLFTSSLIASGEILL